MIFLLILQLLWAGVSQPLPVLSIDYKDTLAGASCDLLKARAKERHKVIRQLRHIRESEYSDDLLKIMDLNYLTSNQYFFDPVLWQDESVDVFLTALVSPYLKEEIQNYGLDNIIFKIKSSGILWAARAYNFPQETVWTFNEDTDTLEMNFKIYKVDYCDLKSDTILEWLPSAPDARLPTII